MIDWQRCTYKSRELNPAFIFLLKILKKQTLMYAGAVHCRIYAEQA